MKTLVIVSFIFICFCLSNLIIGSEFPGDEIHHLDEDARHDFQKIIEHLIIFGGGGSTGLGLGLLKSDAYHNGSITELTKEDMVYIPIIVFAFISMFYTTEQAIKYVHQILQKHPALSKSWEQDESQNILNNSK